MAELTPNSRFALTVGSAAAVCGGLLYAGWFGANMLRDIKDDVAALRSDIRAASTDRWTGRDMRDFSAEAIDLNRNLQRHAGDTGLRLPDVRQIQQANRLQQ